MSAETNPTAGKAWVPVWTDALYQIGVFLLSCVFFSCLVHIDTARVIKMSENRG